MSFVNKKCSIHPDRAALSFCHCCKDFFCEHCLIEAADYYYCAKPACRAASGQAVVEQKEATRAAYARWFCDTCIEATEDAKARKTFLTMNGIGVRLIGKFDPCPRCHSVQSGAWMCLFFIPIFRFDRYRVIWLGGDSLMTRRLKPNKREPYLEATKA